MNPRNFITGIWIAILVSIAPSLVFSQETTEKDLDAFEPTPSQVEQKDQSVLAPGDTPSMSVPPPASTYESQRAKPDDSSVNTETTLEPEDNENIDSSPTHEAAKTQPTEKSSHKICDCRFDSSTPYRERRPTVTGIFGLQAGQYQPVNYIPQVGSQENKVGAFGNYYGGSSSPNVEAVFGAQYNFSLGSLGAQLGGGYYSASNSAEGASFSVIPVTLALTYHMDTLFREPYIVPYITGGAYMNFYNESAGGISVSGNSGIGPFYALGLLFQLDWIDPEAHDSAYTDYGMENTFLFLEARSFIATQDVVNFSTPLQFSGGLKFEF